jgi:hypothetical protein
MLIFPRANSRLALFMEKVRALARELPEELIEMLGSPEAAAAKASEALALKLLREAGSARDRLALHSVMQCVILSYDCSTIGCMKGEGKRGCDQ